MNADLELLKDAVREAGEIALILQRQGLKIESKAGGSPVTNADLAVDDFLKSRLMAARPDYGWLSEETADTPERLTRTCVFHSDPIDGTSAYMTNSDWWSICAAVVENGRPVAGVVFAPSLGDLYEAAAGQGARRNGEVLQVADRAGVEGARIIAHSRFFDVYDWTSPWPPVTAAVRNSLALRLAMVAAGEFDATLSLTLKNDWDLAAGDLIVHEAGGRVTDHLGRSFTYNRPDAQQRSLVCAGPALHSLLLERLTHIED